MQSRTGRKQYRTIYLLESKRWWEACQGDFDSSCDLVLTFDFGLRKIVRDMGGEALYVDHLVDAQEMQAANFVAYDFFRKWHHDSDGRDIFEHRGISFGFSFRLDIWNEFIFNVRIWISLAHLKSVRFEQLVVGVAMREVYDAIEKLGFTFHIIESSHEDERWSYYFPLHRWVDEKLRERKAKQWIRDLYTYFHGKFLSFLDIVGARFHKKVGVFVQEYYPTRLVLQHLKSDPSLRVVLVHYSSASGLSKYIFDRAIPVWRRPKKYRDRARELLGQFQARRCAALILPGGVNATEYIYQNIEARVADCLPERIGELEAVLDYLNVNPISLEVLIGNVGRITSLVDCVCKSKEIPSYLIVNGFMGSSFLDEGKYATVINSYSVSIKKNYFGEMQNVVCLGDPRMDAYCSGARVGLINRQCPTITIGASGYCAADLNSYLAVEFDFLYEVMSGLESLIQQGREMRIVIKVRANGYRPQYVQFLEEYFPEISVEVLDAAPMMQVLERTDFYISIYSQTIIEAACCGIPTLYYKADTEVIDPPFDGNSELVTVDNVKDLVWAIEDFFRGHSRFDAFLERAVLEKYIGPLDGKNLDRNLEVIYRLLEAKEYMGAS